MRRVKVFDAELDWQLQLIESRGEECIKKLSSLAMKAGVLPAVCIPFVYGICIKMMLDLNKIVGIKEKPHVVAYATLGVILAPLFAVPYVSSIIAQGFVEVVGDYYLSGLLIIKTL